MGLPAFAEVARGGARLFLSEHRGDARPGTLAHLRVHDVEAVATEFGLRTKGAPWAREIELRDPGGDRLRAGPRSSRAAATGGSGLVIPRRRERGRTGLPAGKERNTPAAGSGPAPSTSARTRTWKVLRDRRPEGDGVHTAMPGIARPHSLAFAG